MKKDPVLSETLKDCLITAGILSVASIICMILRRFSSTDTHVPMLFVLAVLCVSRFTHGYVYGIIASLLAVSLTVCTMTSRIKAQEVTHLEVETEKMRSNLLRSVSHDIRTPLTSIMGNTSAILDNDAKLDRLQIKMLLEDIRREANGSTVSLKTFCPLVI